ncbi:MAG TPA: ABC transporter ATP-binding protein [Candidatus Thermoplasmatota archaeon]|nr:ABC transporter ATP-binding protein [Candidatus Thermoplasmatota archaeon]
MIVAEHLHKRFDDGDVAVKEAHFDVAPGEIFGLLGSNGAGKTTTVHMILGHVEPTSGRALVNGIDVTKDPLAAKRHVGYVSENVLLYGTLTAEQNFRFFARISGADVPAARERELLAKVGLGGAAKRRVETFSKGMRQRLGIAIAVAKDPAAIVMDEPTTGLDPVGARELSMLMGELRSAGKAILLVTHDIYRLKELADRIAVMRDGELLAPVATSAIRDLEALYHEAMGAPLVREVGRVA